MSRSSQLEAPALTPRKERTRRRILDAAGQFFASRGYAKTTVEEIASGAGVSKALVYHHFPGKEGILDAVLERTLADWNDATRLEAMRTESGGVLDGIAHMLRTSLAYAREHPVLRGLLDLDTRVLADSDAGREMRSQMSELRASLNEAVGAGVACGELREDLDVERAAEIILINHLAFVQHVLDPEWVDVSDDALLDVGLDILVRGLQRSPR
jgi:AcrR family transcriptional regulator